MYMASSDSSLAVNSGPQDCPPCSDLEHNTRDLNLPASPNTNRPHCQLSDDKHGESTALLITSEPSHEHNATLLGSYMNLVTAAIGVGILSYPYAFMSAGILFATLLSIFFALLNMYTLWILCRFAAKHFAQLHHMTFEELIKIVLGHKYLHPSLLYLFFCTQFSLLSFLVLPS